MNFFEHQERARQRTGRLVVLFALAVLLIVIVIDVLAVAWLGTEPKRGESWLSADTLDRNLALILGVAAAVAGVIALASVLRALSLRGGGGKVARQLGGTPVRPDATDPLRRRLHNVVEEMAIASGVPVPEVYVLEGESGINAFAAGYSTTDAAVAVTQGTLEQLDRDELQGVIAHEFSHILNGDMRTNIRLIGLLHGILLLAVVGRGLLHSGGAQVLEGKGWTGRARRSLAVAGRLRGRVLRKAHPGGDLA
ncbi:MAG TPA: M48 family metalloprotease [Burkholderiales bacterium]